VASAAVMAITKWSISGSNKTPSDRASTPIFLLAAAFARRAGYIRCDDQGLPFSSIRSGAYGTPPAGEGRSVELTSLSSS